MATLDIFKGKDLAALQVCTLRPILLKLNALQRMLRLLLSCTNDNFTCHALATMLPATTCAYHYATVRLTCNHTSSLPQELLAQENAAQALATLPTSPM